MTSPPSPRRWRNRSKSIPTGSGAGQRAEPGAYQRPSGPSAQQAINQQQWFNATEQRIANQSAANDQQHASYWAQAPPTSIVNLKTRPTSSGK